MGDTGTTKDPEFTGELKHLLDAEMELRKTLAKIFDASRSEELKAALAGDCTEALQRIESLQQFLEQRCPRTFADAPLEVYDAADEDSYWEDLRRR